jgi:CRISPR-associated exonuclease Cas4
MSVSSLPASLLRQLVFCPRIPYFQEVLGINPARPLWVKQGLEWHVAQQKLSRYREFKALGLDQATRHHAVSMSAMELGLHGIADLVLETEAHVYPVEYKLHIEQPRKGQILQLLAYGLMAEEYFAKPCANAFILWGAPLKMRTLIFDAAARAEVQAAAESLHRIVADRRLPDSPASLQKCAQCEFLNYCNDRE